MDPLVALLTNLSVSLALSTLLVGVMARPLGLILRQLCPAGDASVFWQAFTAVMLYVTPLTFALLSLSTSPHAELAAVIRTSLIAALFGAAVALLFVGHQMARERPRPTTTVSVQTASAA